jgi:hypothetical protein
VTPLYHLHNTPAPSRPYGCPAHETASPCSAPSNKSRPTGHSSKAELKSTLPAQYTRDALPYPYTTWFCSPHTTGTLPAHIRLNPFYYINQLLLTSI